MTTNESTTNERVVVIPEITVPATSPQTRERIDSLIGEVMPKLEELYSLCMELRGANDLALVAMYPHMAPGDGYLTDEMIDVAMNVTGWREVWTEASKIGDMFSYEHSSAPFSTIGLENHEIARGGERDFPRGTEATVGRSDGGGEPIRVEVEIGPRDPRAEGGYIVRDLETGKKYGCTHDQIKEGLESVPAD